MGVAKGGFSGAGRALFFARRWARAGGQFVLLLVPGYGHYCLLLAFFLLFSYTVAPYSSSLVPVFSLFGNPKGSGRESFAERSSKRVFGSSIEVAGRGWGPIFPKRGGFLYGKVI